MGDYIREPMKRACVNSFTNAYPQGGSKIVLDEAVHLNFLPSPLPFANLRLNGAKWYGDYVDSWIGELCK